MEEKIDLDELIRVNEHLLNRPKQAFQGYEMTIMYMMYNLITGERKHDTGCGACRTSTVNRVRKYYNEVYLKNKTESDGI
jgi:hypothetical protein